MFFCLFFRVCLIIFSTRDIKILGWCPAGSVLPLGGEGASLALVGHPSSDGVTIKMLYGVDILYRPALHPIFSYWVD